MSKNFLFKLLLTLSTLAVAVFWLLSLTVKGRFEDFSLAWAIVIISGVWGLAFTLKGIFGKNPIPLKKLFIFSGAGLFILMVLALVSAIALEDSLIIPIIAVIATAALVVSVIAVGGKSWDSGDNQKAGYKNYYQRKAEEEKQLKKDKKD